MYSKGWYFGTGCVITSLSYTITLSNAHLMNDFKKALTESVHEHLENRIKLTGIFKTCHEIRFFPGWISKTVVCDSIHALYELDWIEHTEAHKKKLVEKEKMRIEMEKSKIHQK